MRKELIRLQHELAQCSRSVAVCASVMALASCSAPPGAVLEDDDNGPPMFSGPLPGAGAPAPAAPATQTPTVNNTPSAPPVASANPQSGAPAPGEQPAASNGTPIDPGTPPPNGGNNLDANSGAGGASMVPPGGDQGAAGSSMNLGGAGGEAPIEPPSVDQQPPVVTPPPVTPPPVVTPPPAPAGPDIPCPADATFCSGFEGVGLPEGSVFQPTDIGSPPFDGQIELDTAVVHSGSQSLYLPEGANFYRMLAVPIPGNSFWVRLYTRSNVGFGADGSIHASLFLASTFAPDGPYNGDTAVEIAEQYDQVLLNVRDATFGTGGETPNGLQGTTLANDTWTCMEAQFDGPTGAVLVFVEGEQIIDATGWQPPSTFNSFRFGYLRYGSPPRDVWMDDVVVAASRIGCQ